MKAPFLNLGAFLNLISNISFSFFLIYLQWVK